LRKISRLLTLMGLLAAALNWIRAPNGPFIYLFAGGKIFTGAFAPILVLTGGLAAFLGALRRDWLQTVSGAVTTVLTLKHIAWVTAGHNQFERVCGPAWRSRIPQVFSARMRPSRYTLKPFLPPPVPWQQDVIISPGHETAEPLLADLWQPPASVPRTGLAIIYLHGSAWHYMDKDMLTRPFFRHLAGQGHVILDVAYSLAPKANLHPMVADIKRVIAWLKSNAGQYDLNPERIVLVGASAGAHLALLAAYTPNHPELDPPDISGADTSVRGVVSYYGFADLRQAQSYLQRIPRFQPGQRPAMQAALRRIGLLAPDSPLVDTPDVLASLLGGTPDQVPDLYRLGSPISHVGSHCPPTLLLNGAQDIGIEVSQHRRLHRALLEAGVKAIHVEYPNTEHAFDLFLPTINPAAQASIYDTERFLALLA